MAVCTGQADSPGGRRPLLWFDERSAQSVHFAVQAAGVTQKVPGAVAPPERRRDRTAVHALPTLAHVVQKVGHSIGASDEGCASALQRVQHGVVEGATGPGRWELRQLRGHVRRVRTGVCPTEAPGQAVLVPAAHVQSVTVCCVPGRAVAHGRAGRVMEAAGRMWATCAV